MFDDTTPINIQVLYPIFAADFQVFMATSGAQALTICKTNPPDLVLLASVVQGVDFIAKPLNPAVVRARVITISLGVARLVEQRLRWPRLLRPMPNQARIRRTQTPKDVH